MNKKILIAASLLTTFLSTVALAVPQTYTVTINNISATPKVAAASIYVKYITNPYPTVNGYAMTGINPLALPLVPATINPLLQNDYLGSYIKFGTYNSATQQSTFPPGCKILVDGNINISSVVIHQNYCNVYLSK